MRQGSVLRRLPSGTILIWDLEAKVSFPYYGERAHDLLSSSYPIQEHLSELDQVKFETDETNTWVKRVVKLDGGQNA
jgi:hypothetical protein